MSRIPLRTLRDTNNSMNMYGNKVGTALAKMENKLKNRKRQAYRLWDRYIQDIKTGKLLDGIRAQKLNQTLSKIPLRTTRDATQRIMGQGDKITGALKTLENRIKNIPRQALRSWKDHNDKVKRGKMLDNLRAQQLKNALGRLTLRTLRGSHNSVVLFESNVGKVLDRMDNFVKRRKKEAFSRWEKFVDKCKTG